MCLEALKNTHVKQKANIQKAQWLLNITKNFTLFLYYSVS